MLKLRQMFNKNKKSIGWLVGAILLGAGLIGWLIASQQSLWFDEGYSLMLVRHKLSDLIHWTSVDVHPPLYYLLLKGWGALFGMGEMTLRLFSLICFVLSLWVLFLLLKKLFNQKIALGGLLVVAFSPLLVRYSFEIRAYALMALIGVTASYLLVLIQQEARKSWRTDYYIVYAILVALGVLTHYYMAFLWLGHLVWLTVRAYQKKQSLVKQPWIVAYCGAVVLFLPWLPFALQQVSGKTLAGVVQAMTLENLLGIVTFSFLYQPIFWLKAVMSLLAVALFGALIYLVVKFYPVARKKYPEGMAFLASCFIVPLVVMILVGLNRPVYIERYVVFYVIYGLALLGVLLAVAWQKKVKSAQILTTIFSVALLAGLVSLSQLGNYNFQRLEKIRTRELSQQVVCDGDQVVLASDPYVYIQMKELLVGCPIYVVSQERELVGGYAPVGDEVRVRDDSRELETFKKVYFISYNEKQIPQLLKDKVLVKSTKFESLFLKEFLQLGEGINIRISEGQ